MAASVKTATAMEASAEASTAMKPTAEASVESATKTGAETDKAGTKKRRTKAEVKTRPVKSRVIGWIAIRITIPPADINHRRRLAVIGWIICRIDVGRLRRRCE